MGNFEKMNIIERANKVLGFRKAIREYCRKHDIEYPTDEKVAEWINLCYDWDVDEFMKDYTEHEGIFREPIVDFMKEIDKVQWGANKPTEDEIKAFVATNGYDLGKFITEHTIASYEPLERDTLMATLKLTDDKLVKLWNIFIEESSLYGEDSHIFDVSDKNDLDFLARHLKEQYLNNLLNAARAKRTNYVQWYYLNDGTFDIKTDIKSVIIAYWGDIFERVMLYPYAYQFEVEKYAEGDGSVFFDDVFFPILTEKLGYHIDGDKGTITKIEKK